MMRWKIPAFGIVALGVAALFSMNWSQPGNPNLVTPTMGGQQVWADEFYHVGWRIQRNVLTGHHRLLDPEDHRHAWGRYDECLKKFEAIRAISPIEYNGMPVAFIVKGLGGMETNFRKLKAALTNDGYHVAYISYPSTRQGIADHARDVAKVLNRLDGVHELTFIAHSMGGLVMRQALADGGPWVKRIDVKGLVMIATPNNGARLAEMLGDNSAFNAVTTEAGQNLAPDHVATLPPVSVRHCLVVGSNRGGKGLNPLIDGDDDGVVGVEEVLLAGSDDVLFVEGYHQRLPDNTSTIAGVRRFLDGKRCDGG